MFFSDLIKPLSLSEIISFLFYAEVVDPSVLSARYCYTAAKGFFSNLFLPFAANTGLMPICLKPIDLSKRSDFLSSSLFSDDISFRLEPVLEH
jgi:hypothetical protein